MHVSQVFAAMEKTLILREPDRFLDLYYFSLTHVNVALPSLPSASSSAPLASIPRAAETFSWGAPVVAFQLPLILFCG